MVSVWTQKLRTRLFYLFAVLVDMGTTTKERGIMKNLPWIENALEHGGKLEIHQRDAKKKWRAVLVWGDGDICRPYPRPRLAEALVKLDEKLCEDAGDEMYRLGYA